MYRQHCSVKGLGLLRYESYRLPLDEKLPQTIATPDGTAIYVPCATVGRFVYQVAYAAHLRIILEIRRMFLVALTGPHRKSPSQN
jgi:hypothetical protein